MLARCLAVSKVTMEKCIARSLVSPGIVKLFHVKILLQVKDLSSELRNDKNACITLQSHVYHLFVYVPRYFSFSLYPTWPKQHKLLRRRGSVLAPGCATAYDVSAAVGKLGALAATVLYNYIGASPEFWVMSYFNLIGFILTIFFIPNATLGF
jgi:hypothetical protein